MRLYYKAASKDGKIIRGFIDANTPNDVAGYLRKKELYPIQISTDQEKSLSSMLHFRQKASGYDVILFTRQLSSMLTAGLTLMQALHMLKAQTKKEVMLDAIQGIIDQIEEGKPFHTAIARFPHVFNDLYVSLIRAAEESGVLDKVLIRVADNLEKQEKLKNAVKSALLYPVIVLLLMVVVMVIMMVFVMPQLNQVYDSLDIDLPLSTQIIVFISNAFAQFFWMAALVIFGLVFGFRKWYKTPSGRLRVDTLLLKAPIFGPLTRKSIMVEFTRTFGLLVGTGSLVVDSLTKCADIVGNIVYKKEIENIAHKIEKGVTIGDAFNASPELFPPILVQMVKVGEQTGKLDDSLMRVSEYYEGEVDVAVKGLTTAMEPIIIIVLAVGVGFLIYSVFTPLYGVMNSIK
jgi:type IV pilus assembly protein PilC